MWLPPCQGGEAGSTPVVSAPLLTGVERRLVGVGEGSDSSQGLAGLRFNGSLPVFQTGRRGSNPLPRSPVSRNGSVGGC